MQKEIVAVIEKFFAEHVGRQLVEGELQKIHDDYVGDYEGMLAHAEANGETFDTVLMRNMQHHFKDQIAASASEFQLKLNFEIAAKLVATSIAKFKQSVEDIVASDHCGAVLTALSDGDGKVTLLEPAMLKMWLDDSLKSCHDAYLKDLVKRKDPTLTAVASDDQAWFQRIKEDGRVTVDSVKRVRELFHPALVSVLDGRRIIELVLEGKIK